MEVTSRPSMLARIPTEIPSYHPLTSCIGTTSLQSLHVFCTHLIHKCMYVPNIAMYLAIYEYSIVSQFLTFFRNKIIIWSTVVPSASNGILRIPNSSYMFIQSINTQTYRIARFTRVDRTEENTKPDRRERHENSMKRR